MNYCTIHPNNPNIFLESFPERVGASVGESWKNLESVFKSQYIRSILHCLLLFELKPTFLSNFVLLYRALQCYTGLCVDIPWHMTMSHLGSNLFLLQ